jgi:pyruvate,orthophosphate dikinase
MAAARGLVTTLGGLVSHAAVVARSWGLPAVVGCSSIEVGSDGVTTANRWLPSGTRVTVDGDAGRLLLGSHPATGSELPEVAVLRGWRAQLDVSPNPDPAVLSRIDPPPVDLASEISAADCLRTLALKGMATPEALAAAALVTPDAASATLTELVDGGDVTAAAGDRHLLTPEGTARIDGLYEAEAAAVGAAIEPVFERFDELNLRFKQVVTDWQMRPPDDDPDGEPVLNDHTDGAYDAAVLAALDREVHLGIRSVLATIAAALPRMAVYDHRLSEAMAAIASGDTQMVASPLRDSYHTVWFELHEELIRLTGRNRADEAAAGRA